MFRILIFFIFALNCFVIVIFKFLLNVISADHDPRPQPGGVQSSPADVVRRRAGQCACSSQSCSGAAPTLRDDCASYAS